MKSRFELGYSRNVIDVIHDIDECTVIQGAAYTPSQLSDMVEQGIPVTANNNTALQETQGSTNPTWDVPLERKRGTDVSDLWVAQRRARKALQDAHRLQSDENKRVRALEQEHTNMLIEAGKQALQSKVE